MASKSRRQWELAKIIEATSDIRLNGNSVLTGSGVSLGQKITNGVAAITGTGSVVSGLTAITSVQVSFKDDASLAGNAVTASWSAGNITIKAWKPTSNTDNTPIAATASKNINWLAFGS